MKKTIFILMFAALFVAGCQTGNTAPPPDYGRYIDRAQLALNVGLSIAAAYNADPVAISTAREHSMLTFDLLRDVVDRPEDLPAAVAQLRNVANDIFALCEGVGVNPVRLAGIQETVERALDVLEDEV